MASPHSTTNPLTEPPVEAPAFQWYPKDYLTDPVTVRMSLEAEGAYRRLMDYCWLKGSIPLEMAEIAPLAKARSVPHMTKLWAEMVCKFAKVESVGWIHPRLDEERRKQAESRARRKKAADERWERERAKQMQCISNAPALQCLPSPSSSPSSTPVIPPPDAAGAYEDWKQAWELAGLRTLGLAPAQKDFPQFAEFARRFPDGEWRRLLLDGFFHAKNDDIKAKPASIGWFLYWADWIDEKYRSTGRKPKSETA